MLNGELGEWLIIKKANARSCILGHKGYQCLPVTSPDPVDPTVKKALPQDNDAGARRPRIPHPRSHVCRYTVVHIADLRLETSLGFKV
jgi:hypothetical protein